MFGLALLTLRARAGSFAASFIALFFGAAIILACGGLLETGIRLDTPPERLRNAQIVMTGSQFYPEPIWLAESDVAMAKSVPGVQQAVPEMSSQAGRQKISAIAVSVNASDSVTGVEAALKQKFTDHKVTILTGSARGQAEFADAKPSQETLIVLAAVFGGIAVMVSVLIVASTLSLSIQQRLREMALLRAIGALPSQLRRMIVGETLLVALLAVASAPFIAAQIGGWIFERLVDAGVVSTHIVFHQGWLPLVAGGGVVVLSALGAALLATRVATKVRPIDALGQTLQLQRWATLPRLLLAGLFIVGGVVVAVVTATLLKGPVAASTVGATATLWAVGFALIAPGVARVLLFPLGVLARIFGVAGYLGASNMQARARQVANVLIPIMLTAGLATAMLYMQTTLSATAQRVFERSLKADAIVVSTGDGISLGTVDALRTLPGVAATSAFVSTSGFFAQQDGTLTEDADSDVVSIQGLSANGAGATTAFDVSEGSLDELSGSTVALATDRAESLGKKLGDTIVMQLGDGTVVRPKIVALLKAVPGYETVLMPAETIVSHTRAGLLQQVLIALRPGNDAGQLQQSLGALGSGYADLHVTDHSGMKTLFNKGEQTGVWINYLLAGMIVGYTVIGLVNSLIVSMMERKREVALLRLSGATKTQLMATTTVEGMMTAIAGALFGLFIALLILAPFALGLKGDPFAEGPWWIFGSIVGFTTVLTLLTTWLATLAVLRGKPVEVVGNRE